MTTFNGDTSLLQGLLDEQKGQLLWDIWEDKGGNYVGWVGSNTISAQGREVQLNSTWQAIMCKLISKADFNFKATLQTSVPQGYPVAPFQQYLLFVANFW